MCTGCALRAFCTNQVCLPKHARWSPSAANEDLSLVVQAIDAPHASATMRLQLAVALLAAVVVASRHPDDHELEFEELDFHLVSGFQNFILR